MGYNSGAVEGTVNRVKQLKAAMYGHAKPDLLEKLSRPVDQDLLGSGATMTSWSPVVGRSTSLPLRNVAPADGGRGDSGEVVEGEPRFQVWMLAARRRS